MSRTRVLLHCAAILLTVSVLSVVASDVHLDPVSLLPGGIGLLLAAPLLADRVRWAPGFARWAPAPLGVVLVIAGVVSQWQAMANELLILASSVLLAVATCTLWLLVPQPWGPRGPLVWRLVGATLGAAVIGALLVWYDSYGVHYVMPVVFPALSVMVGLALLGSPRLRPPEHPDTD
jgi:hypothetical protein